MKKITITHNDLDSLWSVIRKINKRLFSHELEIELKYVVREEPLKEYDDNRVYTNNERQRDTRIDGRIVRGLATLLILFFLVGCTKEQSYELPDCQTCIKTRIYPDGHTETLILGDKFCGDFLEFIKIDDGYVMEDGSRIVVDCK